MIAASTPRGLKALIPRGIMRANGTKVAFARVAMRTDDATDIDLWSPGEVGGGGGGSSLAVTIEPPSTSGYTSGGSSTLASTATVTATATGAVGAVTYAWVKTVGAGGWSILSPSSAATLFRIYLGPNENETATFQVTATDSIGRTATATVEAYAENFYYGG